MWALRAVTNVRLGGGGGVDDLRRCLRAGLRHRRFWQARNDRRAKSADIHRLLVNIIWFSFGSNKSENAIGLIAVRLGVTLNNGVRWKRGCQAASDSYKFGFGPLETGNGCSRTH